jgi:hypothetical protein
MLLIPQFGLVLFVIFLILPLQNILAQPLNYVESELSTGIKDREFSTILPQRVISYNDSEAPEGANATEKDEELEKSYESEAIFLDDQRYINPTQTTVIPNATILDVNETSIPANNSILECDNCFISYVPLNNPLSNLTINSSSLSEDMASNETIVAENPIFSGMESNETIPVATSTRLYNIQMKKIDVPNENLTKTLVSEPTIARNGQTLIFLNNYFGARSTDGGNSWKLFNMDQDHENIQICCDQRLLYDRNHNIFIWYAQGEIDNNTNTNTNRIAVSKDGLTWLAYYFRPSDIRPELKRTFFDFPHLVAGNDYLYLLTSVGSRSHLHGIVIRMSLDDLSKCNPASTPNNELQNCGIRYDYYYSLKKPNFAPIAPVGDAIYWAIHISNNKTRIYEWAENSNFEQVKYYDVPVPAWAPLKKNSSACNPINQAPEENWCLRTDSRILTGWRAGNTIGIFWNANYNSTTQLNRIFQFPYINGATFELRPEGIQYKGRPYVYNFGTVFLYPAVAVNSKGEIGMLAYFGEEVLKPSIIFGTTKNIDKNFPWDVEVLKKSSHIPDVGYIRNDSISWGDFTTLHTDGSVWYGTAFVMEGGSSHEQVQPYYITVEKISR